MRQLIRGLSESLDPDTGQFDSKGSTDPTLDHLLATLALTEQYYFSRSPLLRQRVQRALGHAGELMADPTALSDEALYVAWELSNTARHSALKFAVLSEILTEASRRRGQGATSIVLDALNVLACVEDLTLTRLGRALEVRQAAELDVGEAADPDALLRAWMVGEAVRKAGDPAWRSYWRRAKVGTLDSQRKDGEAKGSWQPRDGSLDRSQIIEATSLRVLILESPFRVSRN